MIEIANGKQKPTQNEEGHNETTLSSIFLSSHSIHVYCLCSLDWKFYVCVCVFSLSRFFFLQFYFFQSISLHFICVLCLFLLFFFSFISAPRFAAAYGLFEIPSAINRGRKTACPLRFIQYFIETSIHYLYINIIINTLLYASVTWVYI